MVSLEKKKAILILTCRRLHVDHVFVVHNSSISMVTIHSSYEYGEISENLRTKKYGETICQNAFRRNHAPKHLVRHLASIPSHTKVTATPKLSSKTSKTHLARQHPSQQSEELATLQRQCFKNGAQPSYRRSCDRSAKSYVGWYNLSAQSERNRWWKFVPSATMVSTTKTLICTCLVVHLLSSYPSIGDIDTTATNMTLWSFNDL